MANLSTVPSDYIGWVGEPNSLAGLSRLRPDPAITPRIVGRYDVTPPGGLAKNSSGPFIECSHCRAERHWRGYVLAGAGGALHLVGSQCGPEHYGAHRFQEARNSYNAWEQRASLKARGAHHLGHADQIGSEVQKLLSSDGLESLMAKAEEIRRASPDMVLRLASHVISGDQLTAHERVRGANGQMEIQPVPIGRLEGAALIRCDVKPAAKDLLAAFEPLQSLTPQDWEDRPPSELLEIVRSVERAAVRLRAARREAVKADEFFRIRNRRLLRRWSRPLNRFLSLEVDEGASLLISDARVGTASEIEPLAKITLPRLAACEEIGAYAETTA